MYQSAKIEDDRNPEPAAQLAGAVSVFAGLRSAALRISALTLVGAVLPLLFVETVPDKFSAETRLKIEAAGEGTINTAAAALRSKANLDNVIRALNLGRDSEFAVDRPSVVRVVSDIVSGEAMTVSEAENRLRERLSQAIVTSYDRSTGQLMISVTAEQPDEAARIANMLGDTFHDEIAVSGTKSSAPVVEKLRQTLEHAQAALSGFIAETDEQKLAELRRTEGDGQQLTAEINQATAQLGELRQKAAQASVMKLSDVLNKPLPDSLEYTGLDYQRQRHVEAKLAVDQLSSDLGPRHPRLAAAQAALTDVKNDIQEALKQLGTSLRQQETAAAKRLADLKAKQAKKPDDKEIADSAARLKTLDAAVDEARRNYLDALHGSETKASTAKVSVLVPAAAAAAATLGPSLAAVSGIGALIGFGLGVALAFLTRRRRVQTILADELDLLDEPAQIVDRDLLAEHLDEQDFFGEDDRRIYDQPVYEPQQSWRPRHPAPANDSPLADHIREVLMANRRPAQEVEIPPLVAAVMAGRLADMPAYAPSYNAPRRPVHSPEEIRKAEELRELRRHIAELRERVQVYSARRNASRG
ncbi:lipopolysaccharide biosynthesis protein [Rhizobium sp. CF080]|uniref:LPS biosynthesis protein n=1 Tax=Rhizobium sp. (strain CF080) TaxID=1144310 RepID=UPI0003E7F72B|nr:LPS biosynthesis protein [Rhizobium sp. CF080]EUC00265.1 lipopolysaccharide biosynthesis protein [Rhizobium sp. CF080]